MKNENTFCKLQWALLSSGMTDVILRSQETWGYGFETFTKTWLLLCVIKDWDLIKVGLKRDS